VQRIPTRQLALLLVCLGACGTDESTGPNPRTVASVAINPGNSTLGVGLTETLVATPIDDNGNLVTGITIQWSSSDSQVATVNSQGVVTAVAVGSVSITARAGGQDGTANVTVSASPPNALQLIFSTYLGGSQQDRSGTWRPTPPATSTSLAARPPPTSPAPPALWTRPSTGPTMPTSPS
jgi:hypothetical protein